ACMAEVVLVPDRRRQLRERLAVHVIEHGRQQQQTADAVAPPTRAFASRLVHTSHSVPFQAITRSSSATTSPAKARNRTSPFSAEACCGKPMWPGSVRSLVIHARCAGANARPHGTSAAAR